MEYEGDSSTSCNPYAWNGPQRLKVKELEELEISEHAETIQTIALLRLAKIQQRILEN